MIEHCANTLQAGQVNLMRSELTATQQAEHLAKRKELWEIRNNATTSRETPGQPKGFAGETAAATGTSTRDIQRATSRAQGVTEEVRNETRGTDLERGTVRKNPTITAAADRMDVGFAIQLLLLRR
tara:strand:+ start:5297 stop:5674 length:378 start_codon:yes stop_codon:yes gene_type:complete